MPIMYLFFLSFVCLHVYIYLCAEGWQKNITLSAFQRFVDWFLLNRHILAQEICINNTELSFCVCFMLEIEHGNKF